MKQTKKIELFLAFLSGLLLFSCNPKDPIDDPEKPVTEFSTEIISDLSFKNGFKLTPLLVPDMSSGYVDTLYFYLPATKPLWAVAQWNSKTSNNLKDAVLQTDINGNKFFANAAKKIMLSTDTTLYLELNASKEYDHPRLSSEPWPHVLIEQTFSFAPLVSTAKRIMLSVELQLVKYNTMISGYDPNIHTAQSPMYLVIRGVSGDGYIWFGIPSFDIRDLVLGDKLTMMLDPGTNAYMIAPAPKVIWGDITFKDKKWHKANLDIKPYIKQAHDAMINAGQFKNTKFEDLKIEGINFGWEVTGTFDVGINIKHLSLKIVK